VGAARRPALQQPVRHEVIRHVCVLLGERGRAGARPDPVRVEQLGPGVIAPGDPRRQQLGGRGAHGEPPLLEAGGYPDVRRERVVAADVGHAVRGHLVLRRPAQLRLDAEALARPGLEAPVALGGVGLAGLVALAADEQPVAVRADRVRGRLGREVHPGGPLARSPRDHVRALRVAAREVEPAVEERQVRGNHHVAGVDARPGRRGHAARVEAGGGRALVERAAQRGGEAVRVPDGVELRLVVEAHGAGHREGQVELLDVRGRQPQLARELGLRANGVAVRLVLGVRWSSQSIPSSSASATMRASPASLASP
jgi:hypothetical protein